VVVRFLHPLIEPDVRVSRIRLSDHLLPEACAATFGGGLASRYSVRGSLRARSIRSADFGRDSAFPRGGSPAAFPCSVRLMKVAALPSLRFSRSSTVLWPPPIPGSASFLRFRVSPLYASLPCGVTSAGPFRVSPVNSLNFPCVPPSSTPSRRTGVLSRWYPVRGRLRLAETGSPRDSSRSIGLMAGGGNDAETTFTAVAARRFASPSCRLSKALSSRFSVAGCPAPEGIRLSGERVISRVGSFQSTSSFCPLGRTYAPAGGLLSTTHSAGMNDGLFTYYDSPVYGYYIGAVGPVGGCGLDIACQFFSGFVNAFLNGRTGGIAHMGASLAGVGFLAATGGGAAELGDLTAEEIGQIQAVVDQTGRPLEVVGSAAAGMRGLGSDLDIVIPPASMDYFQGLEGGWPAGSHVFEGIYNPFQGPGVRFEPGAPPVFLPGP
jgi:hypothetical protein